MKQRYKRIFECDCTKCEKRETCEKKKNLKESIKVCESCSCDVDYDLNMDHGDQYEDNTELDTGVYDGPYKDKTNGGEEFGDAPAEDEEWSESKDRYKKIFEDNLDEECPGKPAGGGMCANSDNSGKLKGVCQNGYIWDKVHEKCVPVVKK